MRSSSLSRTRSRSPVSRGSKSAPASKSRRLPPAAQKQFNLHIRPLTGSRYLPYLRRYLRAAHAALQPALQELSVALVNDARMSRLHEQFLGISGPTDVLSFPLEEDARGRVTSGEVVICVPEARRQSQQHQTSVEQELLLYALHGMLHLSGFDDRTAGGYRTMHRTEDDILASLGVGPVFAASRRRSKRDTGEK